MDELCGVCGVAKPHHMAKNHEFNANGELIPKRRSTPPMKREASGVTDEVMSRTILRLVHVLTSRGLLEASDLAFIFGGTLNEPASDDGHTAEDPGEHRSPSSPS